MRVALIFQWLRAAKQDPSRREACLTYVTSLAVAQIGWIVQIFLDFNLSTTFILTSILTLSVESALACLAGMILTFTMWWIYFMIPSADVLHHQRERSFLWGYGHIILLTST